MIDELVLESIIVCPGYPDVSADLFYGNMFVPDSANTFIIVQDGIVSHKIGFTTFNGSRSL